MWGGTPPTPPQGSPPLPLTPPLPIWAASCQAQEVIHIFPAKHSPPRTYPYPSFGTATKSFQPSLAAKYFLVQSCVVAQSSGGLGVDSWGGYIFSPRLVPFARSRVVLPSEPPSLDK